MGGRGRFRHADVENPDDLRPGENRLVERYVARAENLRLAAIDFALLERALIRRPDGEPRADRARSVGLANVGRHAKVAEEDCRRAAEALLDLIDIFVGAVDQAVAEIELVALAPRFSQAVEDLPQGIEIGVEADLRLRFRFASLGEPRQFRHRARRGGDRLHQRRPDRQQGGDDDRQRKARRGRDRQDQKAGLGLGRVFGAGGRAPGPRRFSIAKAAWSPTAATIAKAIMIAARRIRRSIPQRSRAEIVMRTS